ncbi:MAG: TolC family protein [Candidatus Sumerlaeaceae bacterium]|nr:TolC family protein [Candidatus Sumerlaeaceae bacterium]
MEAELLGEDAGTTESTDLAAFESYLRGKNSSERSVTVNEVILRLVCKNLNIKLKDIANRIAHDQFHVEEGIFDVQISGSVQSSQTVNPGIPLKNDALQGSPGYENEFSRNRQNMANATVGQLLPTGGLVQLLFENSGNYTNASKDYVSPYYQTQTGIQLSQPLLKNAGPLVTQANIVLSQYNNMITSSQFRQQVIEEISFGVQQYYELIFTVANVDVLRISLAQAEELLRVNSEKYKAGVLPELDVLQAQSDVASRQEDIITALQQVETVSDALKTRLAEICEERTVSLRPGSPPDVFEYAIKERTFLNEAICYRPEFEQVKLEIEKANLDVKVKQNQTMPAVDFFANYLTLANGKTNPDSINNSTSNDGANWAVGVQFSYALQNRKARYQFHQAEKLLDASFVQMQQTRDNIIFDVREKIRAVETNRQKIEVGKSTVRFNKAKVDSGQKRQAVGLATSFDVLAFQRDLATARINLIRAVVDYNKAIVALEAAKGTLLDRLNLVADGGVVIQTGNVPKKPFAVEN